jgi:hypothetical protein
MLLFPGSNSVASVSVFRPIRGFYPSWPTDQTGREHVVTGQAGQSGSSGENFLQFVRRIKNHIVDYSIQCCEDKSVSLTSFWLATKRVTIMHRFLNLR